MAMKRRKVTYVAAVPKKPAAGQSTVPSSHKEALGRSIRQKVRQNEAERVASMEIAGRYMVR